jgi:hypothetical protein
MIVVGIDPGVGRLTWCLLVDGAPKESGEMKPVLRGQALRAWFGHAVDLVVIETVDEHQGGAGGRYAGKLLELAAELRAVAAGQGLKVLLPSVTEIRTWAADRYGEWRKANGGWPEWDWHVPDTAVRMYLQWELFTGSADPPEFKRGGLLGNKDKRDACLAAMYGRALTIDVERARTARVAE